MSLLSALPLTTMIRRRINNLEKQIEVLTKLIGEQTQEGSNHSCDENASHSFQLSHEKPLQINMSNRLKILHQYKLPA